MDIKILKYTNWISIVLLLLTLFLLYFMPKGSPLIEITLYVDFILILIITITFIWIKIKNKTFLDFGI